MLTYDEKLNHLREILESQDFASTKTYKKLLKFLVESTLHDVKLKEYSIALEVFERDPEFNPAQDSSVRVYVSNLRKKLENYYRKSGRNAKYHIHIPSGQYEVEFIKAPVGLINRSLLKNIHLISYSILSTLVIYLYFFTPFNSTNANIGPIAADNFFWYELLNDEQPVKIIIGDDIFFVEDPRILDTTLENPYSVQSIVRKHFINSEQEFLAYKNQSNNDKEYIINDITTYKFFPFHSISSLPKIARLFRSPDNFVVEYSSGIHADDLLKHNIIFLGSFRNLYALDQAVKDGNIDYKIQFVNSYLQIINGDSAKTFVVSGAPDVVHVDYCLVRKVPGPNKNTIILFITFHEAAMTAATDYLLNPKLLEELEKMFMEKTGSMPKYFNIVFKSSGFERTAYKTTIEYFDAIDPSSLSIW